jgi:hypothetical protein
VEKLDQVGRKYKKDLTTQIEGCPYEINMQIVLGEEELAQLGFLFNESEEHITYTLQMHPPEKQMQVNFQLWDYITAVMHVMDAGDTSGWGLAEWDEACPFLFDSTPMFPDEEQMQKERDKWL